MPIIHLTRETFDEETASGIVLVDFWASWCSPCRILAPVIEELAEECDGRAVIAKVDVDSEPELAERFKIRCIPTVICFKDGRERSKAYGAETKEYLEEMIGQMEESDSKQNED